MEARNKDGGGDFVRTEAVPGRVSEDEDAGRGMPRPGVLEVPTCQVCGRGPGKGVASSTLGAVSFSYCLECLQRGAEPLFMWHHAICVCGGWERVHEGMRANATSWKDGEYVGPEEILRSYDPVECERETIDTDLAYAREQILEAAIGLEACLTPIAGGFPSLSGDGWGWLSKLQHEVREHRRLVARKMELDGNHTPLFWDASTK